MIVIALSSSQHIVKEPFLIVFCQTYWALSLLQSLGACVLGSRAILCSSIICKLMIVVLN